jgi:hypothetical protein
MLSQETVVYRGKPVRYDAVQANGQTFVITGKIIRTASLRADRNEWMEDVNDPAGVIRILKDTRAHIDLFKFSQRIPDCEPKYDYHLEMRHVAAIPIKDFNFWWTKQIDAKTRNMVRKSQKLGVKVDVVPFTDEFVRGVMAIFNESPIRQNMPFWHYGKDLEATKATILKDGADSILIAAHFEKELIGFVKLRLTDRYAMITMILDKMTHRHRATMNAMVAKVAEICAERKIPFATYTVWRRGGLAQFQKSNGFEKIPVPEYFVPLSLKGALVLRLGLHKGFKALVPEKTTLWLLGLRTKWYAYKYPEAKLPRL